MSDEIGFEHRAGCPECGSNLHIEQLGVEPSPHDRLGCPTCGFECDRETFHEKHFKVDPSEVRDRVGKYVDEAMRGMIKGTSFTLE